jgi:hypothetical protein
MRLGRMEADTSDLAALLMNFLLECPLDLDGFIVWSLIRELFQN